MRHAGELDSEGNAVDASRMTYAIASSYCGRQKPGLVDDKGEVLSGRTFPTCLSNPRSRRTARQLSRP